MRVAVVAELYPRAEDPVLGVWAHRQAVAARDAGADVRVLVLHRPLPPLQALRRPDVRALRSPLRQPARTTLDGLDVRYVRFLSPPRPLSYGAWGAWAAPALRRALAALRNEFPYDLIHAHYAVPAGEAVRRAAPATPLVVSEHGGDLFHTLHRRSGGEAVRRTFAHARLVLANSTGIADRCLDHGARSVRVVRLGAEVPERPSEPPAAPTVVTVGHLVARKRHADVVRALARLTGRRPELRYVIVGDGPERERLRALAGELGVAGRIELRGQLSPEEARAAARAATVFAMPSTEEAFGVAYVEAMAAGVPAIGCHGEPGPEDIAAAGGGIRLVQAGDVAALAEAIDELVSDPAARAREAERARATVQAAYTWERCGAQTVGAYEEALR